MNDAGPKPLNYLSCEAAADLFERSISALRLELLAEECPAFIVEETVQAMREDFDCTRQYLRTIERSAKRRNPFPGFRVVPFRRAMAASNLRWLNQWVTSNLGDLPHSG
jgi:hypothetical protein